MDALRQSEERYALAMEAAADGHMDWNLVTGEFYILPRMLTMVGHAPDAKFADRADWVRRFPFHPEDRPRWEAAIASLFAGREAKFRGDYRVVVNGETRWLAFNFIVGLIPLLFFVVSVAGFVLSRKAVMEAVLGQISAIVPVYKNELHDTLAEIIRRRRLSSLLGTAVLLLFSSQLFNSIRLVLSDIFGFRGGPGFLRGLLRDVVMVVAMGLLFLGSLVISDIFGWLKILVFQTIGAPTQWVRSWSLALALAFSTAFFFVPYRYFPHRRVPVGAALAGALLAAVLWETAKQIFRWYILSFGVYDQVYGPLGVLVALAMFAYYSGVVFILGAEFAAALMAKGRRA